MNKALFKREKYLKRIRSFYHDTTMIKVITGVRRCGKSSIMHMIADELKQNAVPNENIIFIDLDSRGFRQIKKPDQLDDLIKKYDDIDGIKYLFIDEIQNVNEFEEIINSYRNDGNYSIFITGSNSYLLSGELTTKLTGRYIEFEMMPLSFEEYVRMKEFYNKPINANITKELDSYLLEGGLPQTIFYDDFETKRIYVNNVVKEIFEKDVKRRVKIKNVSVFEKIQAYMINNYGTPTSITNIIAELKKDNIIIKRETLHRYIQILLDAKILYKCQRFDLKTKKSINSEEKYYLSDPSFWFVTDPNNTINYGPALENLVYIYAKSKNYSISVGKIGQLECDFILRNNWSKSYSYIQVAMTIMES
ncbi:MAG: ATP-binding protein, partial [Bacillales bacterium]|nr:ATP-binding protein [Bacillales bacterium]MDY6003914.1 ATP-binding protein [Bacilli bacterium]